MLTPSSTIHHDKFTVVLNLVKKNIWHWNGAAAKLIEFYLFLVYHLKILVLFWNFDPSFEPCSFELPNYLVGFANMSLELT